MNIIRLAGTWLVTTLGALFVAASFKLLLIPYELISGGVSGVSMMIGYITKNNNNIAWLYFVLNVPILVWGWYKVGRQFILWSIYSVVATTLFLRLLPEFSLVQEVTLGAVFGGILLGIGSGITLRYGASTGGFDVVASIITRYRDWPVGMMIFILNGVVISAQVLIQHNWDTALYSLIAIFSAGKVIDVIHISHLKVTAFIISSQKEALVTRLLAHPRGITVINTKGAFSGKENDMLMTVTTRYELNELRRIIREIDPKAFVNIVETVGVMGDFRRN